MDNSLEVLVPDNAGIEALLAEIAQLPPLHPNNPMITQLLGDLSTALLSAKYKAHPELVALGFWLRRVLRTESLKLQKESNVIVKALGLAVHFTPNNVDTMFMYSWVCSALIGNSNIVRLASQATPVQALLLSELQARFGMVQYQALAARNLFVRTDKQSDWSARLSLLADARLLWGGDDSVQTIRALPSKPRTRDVSFADRYSAALIHSDAFTSEAETKAIAQRLWSDTQPHLQQACSSPRVIYWLGDKALLYPFFELLDKLALQHIQPAPNLRNEQLIYRQYAATQGIIQCHQFGLLSVLECDDPRSLIDMHAGQMTYLLVHLKSIEELPRTVTEKQQTLTYAGISKSALADIIARPELAGIDRVVPLGQALDFETLWDGIDLTTSLSRRVVVR